MSRSALLSGIAVAVMATTAASATDVSGVQAGAWTAAGNPYRMVGDVIVPAGQQLTIGPGVEVRAQGHYRFLVEGGTLLAVGAADQPILFTAEDTTVGWRGVRLIDANDASVLAHCIIEYARPVGDHREMKGGAVRCIRCSPTVRNCELRLNYVVGGSDGAGAGISLDESSALVCDNYIHDNTADFGGGIRTAETGAARLLRNRIESNSARDGGGMYLGAWSSPIVENNLIRNNEAGSGGGGGITSWGAYSLIRNNLIVENRCPAATGERGGGGIMLYPREAVLEANTIAGNEANIGGGIHLIIAGGVPISSCLIWGNSATASGPDVSFSDNSVAQFNYCNAPVALTGPGNMSIDPGFVDAAGGNYHLSTGSPCIDAGDPATAPGAGARDMDGQRRVWDGDAAGAARIDIGADEFASFVSGDTNCDGRIDFYDIDPFLLALLDPAAYGTLFDFCDALNADLDGSGAVDFMDVDGFVAALFP